MNVNTVRRSKECRSNNTIHHLASTVIWKGHVCDFVGLLACQLLCEYHHVQKEMTQGARLSSAGLAEQSVVGFQY
jgi:hypothetical protein